jgi:putative membrane fusion protein
MKRSTKALLIIFIVLAAGLYVYLEVLPKIEGMNEKTVVLEYGDLPVLDEAEVLIARDETLFGTKKSGAVTYGQDEGTKVRDGVKIISVGDGAAAEAEEEEPARSEEEAAGETGEEESVETEEEPVAEPVADPAPQSGEAAASGSAIDRVRAAADGSMKMTGSFKADRTAVVSYYADGYEKRLSAENVEKITRGDKDACPAEGESLKAKNVAAGDPVYKLTNNNEWYMIYWVKAPEGAERYATGTAVTVSFGDASVNAEVYRATPDGEELKVILRSDMYYKDLTRVRKTPAEIVFAEYKGLIADKTVIAERDGAPGIFVKQRGGGYKWIPVNILREIDGKCILSVGVYYDKDGKQVNTVNYYDEALADPALAGV